MPDSKHPVALTPIMVARCTFAIRFRGSGVQKKPVKTRRKKKTEAGPVFAQLMCDLAVDSESRMKFSVFAPRITIEITRCRRELYKKCYICFHSRSHGINLAFSGWRKNVACKSNASKFLARNGLNFIGGDGYK